MKSYSWPLYLIGIKYERERKKVYLENVELSGK